MLSLDLTNAPRWHDLAPGVRVQLRPLTTALMVATRSDPAVAERLANIYIAYRQTAGTLPPPAAPQGGGR